MTQIPSLYLYTVQGELREEKDLTMKLLFPHPAQWDRQQLDRNFTKWKSGIKISLREGEKNLQDNSNNGIKGEQENEC